jgi:hypothetical protein
MAGEITIPLAKVKELRSQRQLRRPAQGPPHQKPRRRPRKIAPAPIAFADGNLTVSPPARAVETVPTAQIANIIDSATYTKETAGKTSFFSGWNGAVNGGATIVRATDYGETFTGRHRAGACHANGLFPATAR